MGCSPALQPGTTKTFDLLLLWLGSGFLDIAFDFTTFHRRCTLLWGLGSRIELTGPCVHLQRAGLDTHFDCSNNSGIFFGARQVYTATHDIKFLCRVGSYQNFSLARSSQRLRGVGSQHFSLAQRRQITTGVGSPYFSLAQQRYRSAGVGSRNFSLAQRRQVTTGVGSPYFSLAQQRYRSAGVGSRNFSLAQWRQVPKGVGSLYISLAWQRYSSTGVGSQNFSLAQWRQTTTGVGSLYFFLARQRNRQTGVGSLHFSLAWQSSDLTGVGSPNFSLAQRRKPYKRGGSTLLSLIISRVDILNFLLARNSVSTDCNLRFQHCTIFEPDRTSLLVTARNTDSCADRFPTILHLAQGFLIAVVHSALLARCEIPIFSDPLCTEHTADSASPIFFDPATAFLIETDSNHFCIDQDFPIFFAPVENIRFCGKRRVPIFFAPADKSQSTAHFQGLREETESPIFFALANRNDRRAKRDIPLFFAPDIPAPPEADFQRETQHKSSPIFFDPVAEPLPFAEFQDFSSVAAVGLLILFFLCCTRLDLIAFTTAVGRTVTDLNNPLPRVPTKSLESQTASLGPQSNRVNHISLHRGLQIWFSAQILHLFRCKPGPNSRGRFDRIAARPLRVLALSLCCLILCFQTEIEPTRSEGCILVMEDAEALPILAATLRSQVNAKPHDMRPETCTHANHWLPATRTVVKRSLKRAYARSLHQGLSWYRGRSYTPMDFPKALRDSYKPPIQKPIVQTKPLISCNQRHTDAKRFRVLNWNAGGLSASRLDEVKVWLLHQNIEVAFITETRWCFENTWTDDHFHFIHTGAPTHKGMGILCILAKRFCPGNNLKWRPVEPGRLLHVQMQLGTRSIDLVGCYQHTFAATKNCQSLRTRFWEMLDQFLHGLVQRNILVLAGDFNCDLMQTPSHSGPATFFWKGSLTRGATHADNGRFTTLLRDHGLTALNTWHQHLGPTYIHADTCSRIDYVITRKHVADGAAKEVKYTWDAPFQGLTGHVPMVAHLRKHWFQTKCAPQAWGVTPQQRKQCLYAYQTNAPEWQEFVTQATERLMNCLPMVPTLDADLIPQLHQTANQYLNACFPHSKTVPKPHDPTLDMIVLNKWQHKRALLKLTSQTTHDLFQAWLHLTKFSRLNRQSKQHAKTQRRLRFDEVIRSANHAAQRHDSHALFSIINKFSPKLSTRKMQLRNPQGHIASPIEETAMLKKHVMDTWKGPPTFPTQPHQFSGMPFTVEDLEYELSRIPIAKAVARPCAPAPVWRMMAAKLAPHLHALFKYWWDRPEPFLPSWFRDAWMLLIPKPNKPPTTPGALRPLALQEPISKCVVGLLTKVAQREAFSSLCQLPLWAYLPGRSTQEALLRVSQHCRKARMLIAGSRSTPFTRQRGTPCCRLVGGLQIFLDIEKAFDGVCREQLFNRIGDLGINPQIVLLLSHWHQHTHYHLNSNGEDIPVPVGCGVRQGCRAAPLLWNGYVWLFLVELIQATSLAWVEDCLNLLPASWAMSLMILMGCNNS